VPTFLAKLTAVTAFIIIAFRASAQVVGSGSPSDADLQTQRNVERGVSPTLPGSGIFDIAVPAAGTVLKPARRVSTRQIRRRRPVALDVW
jgi:hypothetical protein